MELITIAIAAYNCEQYIADTLSSALKQTYPSFEIIVVNDGSTDDTLNILNRYNDLRIRIINQANQGLSAARNRGLDESNGKYICFIDADDILEPDYLSKLYACIQTNDLDIAVCGVKYCNDNSECFKTYGDDCFGVNKGSMQELYDRYIQICSNYLMSDSWNKLYNKKFIIESGVRFCTPKGMNGNDFLFNYRLMMHVPRIDAIKECLYIHIDRSGSMVNTRYGKMKASYDYIFKMLDVETEFVEYSDKLRKQIEALYILFERNVFQDILKLSDIRKQYYEIRRLCKEYASFEKKNKIQFCDKMNTLADNIFLKIRNRPSAVWVYILLRSRKIK